MEEIKEKEYIRTDDGRIYQVNDLSYQVWLSDNYYLKIVNHSFDIKDLVQAGDIILYNVNSKMTDIEIVKEHIDARTQEKTLRVGLWSLEQVEIKEISTKEQFNQMKYIVGDE